MSTAPHSPARGPSMGAALAAALGVAGMGMALHAATGLAETPPPVRTGPAPFAGVNIATGGFAPERLPGHYGFDYVYPDKATAAPFLAAGMTAVRVPVIWERLQPAANGPLNGEEMARLDASLREMKGFRHIILDIHNYGSFHGRHVTDSPDLTAAFADLWSKLAAHYKDQPAVMFGLMNEPNGIDAGAWRKAADAAVAAIRRTGAKNTILVPGTDWSGAHNWVGGAGSNSAAFAGFRDPGNNFAFEMHQYLDGNSSGTSPDCVSDTVGAERLASATAWLRANHYRGFLGEFGTGSNPTCLAGLDRTIGFMEDHRDVWIGWTYWAAGGWWGDYFASVQPGADGKPKPQMTVLVRHIRSGSR